ncbi:hypothetical protein [Streptomyces sp. NPDC088775]|uniref:hypothetical protein n=1 Tax=Streptomyces sp. NPDC088775 TaxID=3365896 RepID=UPI003826CBA9
MVKRRDDYEDPHNPDGLSEDEIADMHSPIYQQASDIEICRGADMGDPVADEIFHSWPAERRQAAARQVDEQQTY